jgi:hypothetical protein
MKKSALILCFLVGLIFLSLPVYGAGIQHSFTLRQASQTTGGGETVPLELANRAAITFTQALSVQGQLGPVYTYYGVDGKPSVYVFVFSLREASFPEETEILKKVASGWEVYQQSKEISNQEGIELGKKRITQQGDFLTIVVSARSELGPVVEYFYGLPLHYSAREEALKIALSKVGREKAGFSRVIFCSPFDIWFEFTSGDQKTYISPFYFNTNTAEEVFLAYPMKMTEEQKEKIKSDWERVENGKGFDLSLGSFRITGVPDFDWSYGCSPSAGADVLGYWDAHGYDLLIDYYFDRWDPLEGETDHNVPNVQRELSIAMKTDSVTNGGTYLSDMGPGIRMVCNHPDYGNNYGFSDYTDYDQSLGYLIKEINLGYPAVWNVFSHPTYTNHSMCAMGWGPPDTTYICLHDTWSSTPVEVLVNWNGWSSERYTVAVRPDSASGCFYNTIHAAKCTMNVTNYGAIGDDTPKDFMWHGVDQLFDGTLILSWVVPGDTLIAMDMFTTHVKDSWFCFDTLIIVDTAFGEYGRTSFIDTIGLGLVVEQYSVGSSDTTYGDFILQQYVIKNMADTAIQAYVSLSLDWDVWDGVTANDPYNNLGGMNQQHNLAWQTDNKTAYKKYRFGILRVPIDDSLCYSFVAVRNPVYIWPQEGWRDDQLWTLISTPGWTNYSTPDTDFNQLMTPRKLSLGPDSAQMESFIIFGVDTTKHLMNSNWWRPMLKFCGFYRGDVDGDWDIDVTDIVYLLNYLFIGGPPPLPFPNQGDVNSDDVVNVTDIVYLINYRYIGGPAPIDQNRFLPQPWRSKFVRPSLFTNPNWQ